MAVSFVFRRALVQSASLASRRFMSKTTHSAGLKLTKFNAQKATLTTSTPPKQGMFTEGGMAFLRMLEEVTPKMIAENDVISWMGFQGVKIMLGDYIPTIVWVRRFSPKGLDLLMNVAGLTKEDIKLQVVGCNLTVQGEGLDFWGKKITVDETINIYDVDTFVFDHENVTAETAHGQLKVSFPFSSSEKDKKREGKFEVAWF